MLFNEKSVPPEPYFSAALYLLYQVALQIRNCAGQMTKEQISDLADAVHNVPESLTEHTFYFDEQRIRDQYLRPYDQKWVKSQNDFCLIRTLDNGIEMVRKWQSKPDSPKSDLSF
jgi:hypothetical protein